MATYKFDNFNTLIIDPEINNIRPQYTIGEYEGSVSITLETNKSKLYGVTLYGFPNGDDWGDDDVKAWVMEKLKEFEV